LFAAPPQIGMRLQTDPTVIYGMGSRYNGNIRKADLLTDTPYNTYTRARAAAHADRDAGIDALEAVASPQPEKPCSSWPVGDGSGRHLFARTLAEARSGTLAAT
jgi:UPF0755 protein